MKIGIKGYLGHDPLKKNFKQVMYFNQVIPGIKPTQLFVTARC